MENIKKDATIPEWNNEEGFQKYDDDFWDDEVEIESPIIERRNRSKMTNKERSESEELLSPINA